MAGEIVEVGPDVKHLKPGMRVMGLTGYGAFAEEMVVSESRVIPVPDSMSDETAAAFSMVYGTSYHALKQRAHIQPGKPCWCSAPAAAWAWPRWNWARPWAPP